MAGRPIYRASVKLVEQMGGEEFVLEAVMSGASTSSVARLCDISRGMLYEWLHKDAERWQRYQEAREIGAFALADEALEIADTATSETVAVDRERVRVRQWLAERANKQEFGKDAGVQVNLTVGDLHLTAVKSAPGRPAIAAPVEDAEFEVVRETPTVEELLS
jgi:hypothetical protein